MGEIGEGGGRVYKLLLINSGDLISNMVHNTGLYT